MHLKMVDLLSLKYSQCKNIITPYNNVLAPSYAQHSKKLVQSQKIRASSNNTTALVSLQANCIEGLLLAPLLDETATKVVSKETVPLLVVNSPDEPS